MAEPTRSGKDRRKNPDRRTGADRRSDVDRRKDDVGPPAGMQERRTGWDRRIADRRTGGDRRLGLERRGSTEGVLRAVALQTLRRLVSRLYLNAGRGVRPQKAAQEKLGSVRTELLKPKPDLKKVRDALNKLKGSAVAKSSEYRLARELLDQVPGLDAGGKKDRGRKTPFRRRDSLELLQETLTAPLVSSSTKSESGSSKSGADDGAKRRTRAKAKSGPAKAAKKSPKKATKKTSKKSAKTGKSAKRKPSRR
jgi:hypothetical protein